MILCIDTSTDICSVALCDNRLTISHLEIFGSNAHASSLTPLIEQLLGENKLTFDNIDAVAVSSGPGSYTGLRIGVSTAKGLCYAAALPLIAVPTLDIVAEAIFTHHAEAQTACPMLDARRMEVYTQLVTRSGERLSPVEAKVIDASSFAGELSGEIYFGGNGAAKCKSVIDNANARFVDDAFPVAANMSRLACERFEQSKFEDVAYFEPFYLKEFVATVPKNKVF